MDDSKTELIIETVKSVAEATGQTANAISIIKGIERTTGISKRQSKRLKLEAETDISNAELFKKWCASNPGYYYKTKIGNMELSNIGQVLYLAQQEFKLDENISKEELNKEWLLKFLNVSGQAADLDKQKILAKVLAGQLKKPNCVSYRTLRVLKDLSKKDIDIFEKAISCSFSSNNISFIPLFTSSEFLSVSEIFYLSECGLMDDSNMKSFSVTSDIVDLLSSNNNYILRVKSKNTSPISLSGFLFTEAGFELKSLMNIDEIGLDVIKEFINPYQNNHELHLYRTSSNEKNNIRKIPIDLLS